MPIYSIIHQALVPVRATPSDASEMVTQLLFGELVEVLERDKQWQQIRNQADLYEGWVDEKMLYSVGEDWHSKVARWEYIHTPYTTALCQIGDIGFPFKLVFGSRIPIMEDQMKWDDILLELGPIRWRIPRSSLCPLNIPSASSLVNLSQVFLGAPYLWGGRSPWGVDCSGLTQMVYGLHGIHIPRDASYQEKEGKSVTFAEGQLGDLAFFENDQGKVHHVGIILGRNEIRHASGNAHDDYLDDTGIYNRITERMTHRLCSIKRIL